MKNIPCAICSTADNFNIKFKENFDIDNLDEGVFSARRVPDKYHYQIVRCNKCGLIYSNPILEEKKINLLYKKSKLTYDKELSYLKKTYGYYLRKITINNARRGNLLEIGCGNGFFLEEAIKVGFDNVYGIEPSKQAVSKAPLKIKQKIIVDIFRKGQFKNNFFDVICSFQTLDHIIDPNELLKECYKILRKQGIIFCITHNTNALSAKFLGERSPIYDIEHIHLFNENTLKRIFEKNGFKTINVFNISNNYPLRYWARMFPIPHLLKKSVLSILGNKIIGNIAVNIKAGNIGIVARKNE